MSLEAKYKLLKPVIRGAAAFDQLINGQEAATGRPVSIHILAGGSSPENQRLLREIDELPREYKIVFLEIGEQDGNPFIVTDALSGAPPFRKWFASLQTKVGLPAKKDSTDLLKHSAWQIPVQVNAPTPPAMKSAAPDIATTSTPGDFTRMFQVGGEPRDEHLPVVAAPSPVKAAPGEFTQMFQSPAVIGRESAKTASEPATEKPPAPQAPGEFTQLLRSPIPDTAPSVAAGPSQPPDVSDEFSQLFDSPAPAATEVSARPLAQAPGEFTQLFQTQQASAPAPSIRQPVTESPSAQKSSGEFTSLFQAPALTAKPTTTTSAAQPVAVAKQADPDATLIFQATAPVAKPSQPPPSAPGEFTQMFASPLNSVAPSRSAPAGFDALFNQSPTEEQISRGPSAPAANSQPGEFTRMLESPLARSGLKPQNPVAPQPERFSMKGASSGFTQMLESPVSPHSDAPSMPAPARQEKASGEATRAFRFPESPALPPPAASDAPPPPAGPSEFTQMFKAPPTKEEPKPEKPAAKPVRVKPRRKPNSAYLKWILAASGILLIIAIVIFFAVRD